MLGDKTISFPVVFGKVLRRLRKEAGLSQESLGFDADLQRNYISLMELGRYQPTIESVFKLANALKLPPAVLVAYVEAELSNARGSTTSSNAKN